MLLAAFVKSVDNPAPGLALAVVDLSEIKHRALCHPIAGAAPALDNAPVTARFAVLPSSRNGKYMRDDSTRIKTHEKAFPACPNWQQAARCAPRPAQSWAGDGPIPLLNGGELRTLRDAGNYTAKLPKHEHDSFA